MSTIDIVAEGGTSEDEIEVLEIHVAVGDQVEEGALLIEIATDKSNLELSAPQAGTITAVNVAEDDVLTGDTVLMVLQVA